jgi:hypothetical protein
MSRPRGRRNSSLSIESLEPLKHGPVASAARIVSPSNEFL